MRIKSRFHAPRPRLVRFIDTQWGSDVFRAFMLAVTLASFPHAQAWISLNDGRDQYFINASAGLTFDSNIYSVNGGDSDLILNGRAGLEYQRKGGMIKASGEVNLNAAAFLENSSENYLNPDAKIEFTKDTGRTTGSLAFDAARESRADSAANIRTNSWTYGGLLRAKYPVIERYSIKGEAGFNRRDYSDNRLLTDLTTTTLGADLLYAYTSQWSIVGGYRLRVSHSADSTQSVDHALTAGVVGKLTPKLTGSLRAGYQFRDTTTNLAFGDDSNDSATVAASLTWSPTRRLVLTGQLTKDFTTASTNVSIDALTATFDAQLVIRTKLTLTAGLGYSESAFLGVRGGGRDDTYAWAHAGATYTFNDTYKASVALTQAKNWSSLRLADFNRTTVSVSVSARW